MSHPLPQAFLGPPLAHRAYHDRGRGIPENSRAAVQAAIDAGYGVELDVQLSADGEAMVFHDYGLDRLTGESGKIRAHTRPTLESITLNGGTETIPSLDAILDLVAGRIAVLIEIKDQDGAMQRGVGPLETAVARAVSGYMGPLAVMSFNPHAVAAFADAAPDVPRGLTTCAYLPKHWPWLPPEVFARLREVPDYDRVGASFISHRACDLARPRVAELKAAGAAVLCWTVYSAEEEAAARKIADNVTFEGYAAALP